MANGAMYILCRLQLEPVDEFSRSLNNDGGGESCVSSRRVFMVRSFDDNVLVKGATVGKCLLGDWMA